MMRYTEFFKQLHVSKVKYILAGRMAVNVHNSQPVDSTMELIIEFEKDNVNNFLNAMNIMNYKSGENIGLKELLSPENRSKIEDKGKAFYTFRDGDFYDVNVILNTGKPFERLWIERDVFAVEGIPIAVMPAEAPAKKEQ